MPRPALEVAQIFCHHGIDYRKNQRLSPGQHKAMRDIERCRTARLGGHVDSCSQGCGYLAISYNSCRNRHCPKCQSLKQAKWLAERLERLLPTHYFHLVVTLPHELNPLARFNPELVFNLLFESVSCALQQFARDYERLQAQVGFTAVLHTWDQVLNLHPHLHLVVTGGGLSALFGTPAFQSGLPQSLLRGRRGVPDISWNAAGNGGVLIYVNGDYLYPTWLNGWLLVAGTSASTPQLAGVIALANQLRAQKGKQSIGYLNPVLYTLPARDFNDILPQTFGPAQVTLDNNQLFGSGLPGYLTTAGYDLTTGLGSPKAYQFVHDLADVP